MTKKRKLARSVTGRGLAVLLLMLALSPSTAWAEDLLKEHEQRAVEYIEAAKEYRSQEDYANALTMFMQAYLFYPNDPMITYSIARCYQELGNCKGAHEYFSKALIHPDAEQMLENSKKKATEYIATNPGCAPKGDPSVHHQARSLLAWGLTEYLVGNFDLAIEKFVESVQLVPDAEVYLRLALVYQMADRPCGWIRKALVKAWDLGNIENLDEFMAYLQPTLAECPEEKVVVEESVVVEPVDTEHVEETEEVALTNEGEEVVAVSEAQPVEQDEWMVTTAWITGGLALVSFVTGAVFYVQTQDLQDQVDQEIAKTRFDSALVDELASDGETSATLSNVFLWGGAGLAVVSIVLFVVDGMDEGAGESSVSFGPLLLPKGYGASVGFEY